eukprot:GILI01002862.1.p2 GENE.GILI01002862.1~~GILI01002862.1.p2  ORF type:complete len:236 (+),score=53.74 GILI01002862.1:86-793(+)
MASPSDPLTKACKEGNSEEVKRLIREGIDVNQKDKNGSTALFTACWYGRESVANLLLEHGAEVNAQNVRLNTPLHLCVEKGHVNIVLVLLMAGADPEIKNSLGQRAIDMNDSLKPLMTEVIRNREYTNVLSPAENQALSTVFKEIDTDNNGMLSLQECVAFNQFLEDVSEKDARADARVFIAEADVDKNGCISREEWLLCWAKLAFREGHGAVQAFLDAFNARRQKFGMKRIDAM